MVRFVSSIDFSILGVIRRQSRLWLVLMLPIFVSASVHEASAAGSYPRTRVTAGSELAYPPYALVTKDGEPDGFSVDLLKAVCKAMKIELSFRVGPWSEIRSELELGQVDVLPLVSYSHERDQVFDFSVTHTVAHGIAFKRKGSPGIKLTSDLRGKSIIVMRADAAHDWLLRNDVTDRLALTDTVAESLRFLAEGKYDFAVVPRLVGLLTAKELGLDNIETTGPPLDAYGRGYGFAVRERDFALLKQLNEGLSIVRATGRYDEIYAKWFGAVDPKGIPTAVVVEYVGLGIGGFVLFGGLVFTWIFFLRRTVHRQTERLRVAYDDVERQIEERTRELNGEIAERKSIEDSLRRSEALLRSSQRRARIGSWEYDFSTGATHWSHELFGIYGFEPGEVEPSHDFFLTQIVHPDNKGILDRSRDDLLAEGNASYAFKFLRKDGSAGWAQVVAEVVYNEDGQPKKIAGTTQDITAIRQVEEALRKNEALLTEMGRTAKIGGWEHDLRTNEAVWTAETYRIVGISEDRKPPGPDEHLDFYSADAKLVLAEAYQRTVETGEPFDLELRCFSATGRPFWCRAIGHPVFENGRCVRVFGAFQDISDQKLVEQGLRESERRLSTLIGNLPGVAYRCRCDRDWTMEFISDGIIGLAGYAPADLIANAKISYGNLIHSEDRDAVWTCVEEALDQRRPFATTYRIVTADGTEKWVWEQGQGVFDKNGGVEAVEGLILDVTENKTMEHQLAQAQKMEAVGQLTGGVAHDFNNLMQVVGTNMELLLDGVAFDPRLKKLVEHSLAMVQRGATLTHRLLAFSRRQALSPEVIDLGSLVRGLEDMLRRTLGETIEVRFKLAADAWPVFADPHQLEAAVLNLALNARDAMPEGGVLSVEISNAPLDEHYVEKHDGIEAGDFVLLAISDSGVGISADDIVHVFEPFFTTKDVGKGSGLGLSMVYGFVKQSMGLVAIYSEEGKGTTVKLYLPRDRSKTAGNPVAVPHRIGNWRGTERILVVEDEDAVRCAAVEVLRKEGYEIIDAADGVEALGKLRDLGSVDLLFTDVVLPKGMSGPELAEKASELQPGLKTLFTTGYAKSKITHDGMLDHGVNLIIKPYRLRDLLEKIRLTLGDAAE